MMPLIIFALCKGKAAMFYFHFHSTTEVYCPNKSFLMMMWNTGHYFLKYAQDVDMKYVSHIWVVALNTVIKYWTRRVDKQILVISFKGIYSIFFCCPFQL